MEIDDEDTCPFWGDDDESLEPFEGYGPCINCGRDTVCADYSFEFDTGSEPAGLPLSCMACGARWGGFEDDAVHIPEAAFNTTH